MVEITLPKNSRINEGKTWPKPADGANLQAFRIYRWNPDDGQNPRIDTYHVDRDDCGNGCVATGGTFANALNFIEFGPRRDKVDLLGINPGVEWKITPKLTFDASGNWNRSRFTHEAPTIMPITAPNSAHLTAVDGSTPGRYTT